MQRVYAVLLLFSVTASPFVHAQASDELVDTVIGFLADSDQEIRAIAFEQIRNEVKGQEATKQFAAQLPKLEADAQIGLLRALGERGDAVAKSAVAEFVNDETNQQVRVAAVGALGKLGDADDCAQLIDLLKEQDEVANAAAQALFSLRGADVSRRIVNKVDRASQAQQIKLIEILTLRRAKDTIPDLLKLAKGRDASVRIAAMKSLGQVAETQHVPALINAVLIAKPGNERNDAERNLMRVCNRIEDKDKRADPLLSAMKNLNREQQTAILPALGRVGGQAGLVEIEKAINSRNGAIHLAGIRGLSNWPDASVAARLVKLARTDEHPDHRRIARMTILRVAPLPDGRTNQEKLELLKTGMRLAQTDRETNYGLKRAAPIRLVETMRFALPYVDQPKYANEACRTIVELAHDRKLRDDNKAEFHAALDKVIATTKDPVLIDRANRYKRGQTWVRPKSR